MPNRTVLALVACGLLTWAAAPAMGQEAGGEGEGGDLTRAPLTTNSNTGKTIYRVKFLGGTLNEFVEYLGLSGPKNFVYDKELLGDVVRVPPMELYGVSLETLMQTALRDASKGFSADLSDGKYHIAAKLEILDDQEGRSVFFIDYTKSKYAQLFHARDASPRPVATEIEAFGVDQFAGHVDEAIGAIEAAMSFEGPGSQKPDVRFHEPSGLLLVRATKPQLELIGRVLEVTSKSLTARADERIRLENTIKSYERRDEELNKQYVLLSDHYEKAKTRLDKFDKLFQNNNITETEYDASKNDFELARYNYDKGLKIKEENGAALQSLRDRLKALDADKGFVHRELIVSPARRDSAARALRAAASVSARVRSVRLGDAPGSILFEADEQGYGAAREIVAALEEPLPEAPGRRGR